MKLIALAFVLTLLPLPLLANPAGNTVLFLDDIEGDVGDWTTVDHTAFASPHFHLDTYCAFDDPAYDEDYSWWCGTFDYDADGGYGNSWDDRLELPTVVVEQTVVERTSWGALKALYLEEGARRRERPAGVLPVLTFSYRYDTEPYFDRVYVQVESAGVWVTLNDDGWDGSSGGWQDLGPEGYQLTDFGNELNVRFRFLSDGEWSDEDGFFTSTGGAVHLDNIVIYDYLTGDAIFSDDCQTGGVCTPAVLPAAGDWWHVVDRRCPAYSDPHCWWCGDDADTGLIPPNLDNSLVSPFVDLSGVITCTVRFRLNSQVPTVDYDYYIYYGTIDGGLTWHPMAAYWGDFAQCYGWSATGVSGYDLFYHCGGTRSAAAFMVRFKTTDNGCGPGAAGGAGIYLDDLSMNGDAFTNLRSGPYVPWSARLMSQQSHVYAIPGTPYDR
jgi:hypothetical protein